MAGGFTIVRTNGDRHSVQWDQVIRIAAYKRDLITTDEIMLGIEIADRPGLVQEVSEEWTDFPDLFASMEKHLGISPAWYREIMMPAFATSSRILYERPGSPALTDFEVPAG
jgi:hypothetical protein